MKLNRLLAIAATLALGATLFTATSASALEYEVDGNTYTYTVDGSNATITDYTGPGGDIDTWDPPEGCE